MSSNSFTTSASSPSAMRARRRPASESALPSVMSGSTTRRSSLAFGSVVRIVSARMRAAHMFRISARRWELLRESWRPDSWCRMSGRPQLVFAAQRRRRPALDAHAERQPVALEDFLDLRERLLAEVRRAKELDLGALHQVADVVDVFGLEAVRAPDRELELVHGAQQDRVRQRAGLARGRLALALEVDEHRELLLQDAARAADRLVRVDRAVRLDIDDQLVEVGALLDARGLDAVGHAAHRRERRVELQAADRPALLLELEPLHGRAVAAAALDLERHRELDGLVQVRDHEIRVDDHDVVVDLDVAGRDRARPLLDEPQLDRVARVHLDRDRLQVQQDVDDVLLDALDAGVLVEHALDLHLGHGAAGHRGEQDAPQRVAERVAEAALERLDHDARLARRRLGDLDGAGLEEFRGGTLHCRHLYFE